MPPNTPENISPETNSSFHLQFEHAIRHLIDSSKPITFRIHVIREEEEEVFHVSESNQAIVEAECQQILGDLCSEGVDALYVFPIEKPKRNWFFCSKSALFGMSAVSLIVAVCLTNW